MPSRRAERRGFHRKAWFAPGLLLLLTVGLPMPSGCAASEPTATTTARVHGFISRPHPNGIRLADALALGPQSTPALMEVLNDASRAQHWSVAAAVLAMLGEPDGVAAVIDFIERPGAFPPGVARWARANALLSLGYAVHQDGGARALGYLIDARSASFWRTRLGPEGTADVTITDMREHAILGLALTGQPRARTALLELQTERDLTPALQGTLTQALGEWAVIEQIGIHAYDQRRWQ